MSGFDVLYCRGKILKGEYKYGLTVVGEIDDTVKDNTIRYIAAAPADYRQSYTGSGLPFPNQLHAFERTPNKGMIKLGSKNSFSIKLMTPNSFYVGLGSVLVQPTLYLTYINGKGMQRVITIELAQPIPYRMLTYPAQFTRPLKNVSFFDSQFTLYPRSQEAILRSSAYPCVNSMYENFWGQKPPL